MINSINSLIKSALLSVVFVVSIGTANAVILDTWNDVDLDASGDFVTANIGATATNTWFSVQWGAGAGNTLGAIGLDTVFYNSSTAVSQVWEGAIGIGGTNVTSDWKTNFGGTNAGGGFGNFLSQKNLDGGTTAGISSPIFFVLDGITNLTIANANGSTFAAHVRYEQGCSGWVSDGRTNSTDSGSCGSTNVPEPTSLLLLGVGLSGFGLARRRKV